MAPVILRSNPSPDDASWEFNISLPRRSRPGMGLHISFSPERVALDLTMFPQNRILQSDDISRFVLVSFEKLRFPDTSPRVAEAYMTRFFKAGLFLNGVQFRFYGHSNSQLVCSNAFLCPRYTHMYLSVPAVASYVKRIETKSWMQ